MEEVIIDKLQIILFNSISKVENDTLDLKKASVMAHTAQVIINAEKLKLSTNYRERYIEVLEIDGVTKKDLLGHNQRLLTKKPKLNGHLELNGKGEVVNKEEL